MAKRRVRGEGTLYRLHSGKWRAMVTIHDRRLSKVFGTWKEASEWIKSISSQAARGLTYDKAKVTTGEYLERWLESSKGALRPTSYQHYTILINKYLIPALGDVAIKDLAPDYIQHIYDGWAREKVGTPTILKTHAVLHAALQRAAETGLTYRNAAEFVTPPRITAREMSYWTEEEANRFLTAALDNRLYALFYLAIVTGARQMELLGLRWSDVDWLKGTLRITRQLARTNGMFAPLKTRAARRTLHLGDKAIVVLKEHQDRQRMERQAVRVRWKEYDLIFTSTTGGPMHHKNLTDRYFKPVISRAGVPPIRFHDLRHTAAAIMLTHGRPLFHVSKILGHARPSITSDTYGHLVPGGEQDSIIAMMDELVAPVEIDVDDLAP